MIKMIARAKLVMIVRRVILRILNSASIYHDSNGDVEISLIFTGSCSVISGISECVGLKACITST